MSPRVPSWFRVLFEIGKKGSLTFEAPEKPVSEVKVFLNIRFSREYKDKTSAVVILRVEQSKAQLILLLHQSTATVEAKYL